MMYGSNGIALQEFTPNSTCHRHLRLPPKHLIAPRECVPALTLGDVPIESFTGEWFALHGWSGREKELARKLAERRIAYFLPLETRKKISGEKRYDVHEAVFAGYTFICADPADNHLALFDAADVARALGQTPRIVPGRVPAFELANLHIVCASRQQIAARTRLKVAGARVVVRRGKLQGLTGYIVYRRKNCRIQVQVTSMASSVELDVDEDEVEVID